MTDLQRLFVEYAHELARQVEQLPLFSAEEIDQEHLVEAYMRLRNPLRRKVLELIQKRQDSNAVLTSIVHRLYERRLEKERDVRWVELTKLIESLGDKALRTLCSFVESSRRNERKRKKDSG